jgi:hypothetical protein
MLEDPADLIRGEAGTAEYLPVADPEGLVTLEGRFEVPVEIAITGCGGIVEGSAIEFDDHRGVLVDDISKDVTS